MLVLSSAERPLAPQRGFSDALLQDLVRSSRQPLRFVEISIAAARDNGEESGASIAARIRSAFASGGPDLVMTIGGPAATFAQQYRRELFPTTPMVLAGVDRRFVENGTFSDYETTVATQHDPAAMIDEILRLLPDTRSVMVVIGTSPVEQFWLQQMKREFARFGDRLQFSWTNDLSFAAIRERARTMPPRSAIFFALLSVDGKGEPQVEGTSLASLHAAANAPLFALYGLGNGIVGGPMLSTDQLSRTTAQVALRVLAGESPGRIQTPVQRTGQPTYDARELQRWNIDESRLPPASVVLFRQPTAWERNRRPVLLGAVVGGVPIAALVLAVGAIKQRRAQKRRAVTAAARTPSNDIVGVWTAGADGQRLNAAEDPGIDPHRSWTDAVHPEDVERCRAIYRDALVRREPFQMEYRVRDSNGRERWILDTGVVRFEGAAFAGYVGTAIDITTMGRTRAELSNLSQHLIQAQERERSALARTLHEDVCQRMVALTLRLHTMKGAEHDADVADIRDTLARLAAELASVPDPAYGQLELLGLAAASQRFCEDLALRHDVAIHFEESGVPRDLPSDIAIALFRVVQEATLHAVVHGAARDVRVSMFATAADVRLRIVDRARAGDTSAARADGGFGLAGIRERLKLVDGDCVITSNADGTRVEARVPLLSAGS